MGDAFIDELSPSYLREKRISLSLDASNETPSAFHSIMIAVDYEKTLPEGIQLPLIVEIQGPSSNSYERRVISRTAPTAIIFRPSEGGAHHVTMREAAHNRWWGSIVIDVAGELLEAPKVI